MPGPPPVATLTTPPRPPTGTIPTPVPSSRRIVDLGTLGGYASAATAVNRHGQVAGYSEFRPGSPFAHAFLWDDGILHDLGTLGGEESIAQDLDDGGRVVGTGETATRTYHAFLWEDGRMHDLGTLGGDHSEALALNNHGQVVGRSATAGGEIRAFLWEDGRMTDLGTAGDHRANDVNDAGQIVGTWQAGTGRGAPPGCSGSGGREPASCHSPSTGCSRSQVAMTEELRMGGSRQDSEQQGATPCPPAVPDRRSRWPASDTRLFSIAGREPATGHRPQAVGLPLSWQGARAGSDLGTLGGAGGMAAGVDDGGRIVGTSGTAGGTSHAFLWADGVMHDLGALPGGRSSASAINNRGQIVGGSTTVDPYVHNHAVLWQGGHLIDLGTLTGTTGTSAAGDLNDDGVIVGWSSGAAGAHAVLWS